MDNEYGIEVITGEFSNDNESSVYKDFLTTEYVDDDNDIAEIEYSNSSTVKYLLTAHPLNVMKRIGLLTKFTKIAYDSAIEKSPEGLTEKSIVRRWGRKQYALGNAVMNYIKETSPKLYRRLFRENQPLWNLLLAICINEMDNVVDNQ